MPKNIKEIRLWENNPDKSRTSHVVRMDFNFPCTWTTFDIVDLLEIIRLWIIAEERRFPPSSGFKGRELLYDEIKKVFER